MNTMTMKGKKYGPSSDRDRMVLLELLEAVLGIWTDPTIPGDTDWERWCGSHTYRKCR